MNSKYNSVLDSAALAGLSIIPNNLVLYGFNIANNDSALVQSGGSSYFDMQVVDSGIDNTKVSEMSCGSVIKRLPNLLTFELPLFYRSAFIIAKLDFTTGVDTRYNRLLLEYGTEPSRKEISRVSLNTANRRDQAILMGSYIGLTPSDENRHHKFVIQSFGNQQYHSVNVLIGVII